MTDSTASAGETWTVQRILQWTTDYFQSRGFELPRLEAELLLAHARQCQRIRLYTDLDVELSTAERGRMREYVHRRAGHEPLAYITGTREFYGRTFHVGPGVLVPRPETETLIDVCLEYLPQDIASSVCEVGFGSGCISVTLARQRPQLKLVATDISDAAHQFARQNCERHSVSDRICLESGSVFEPLKPEQHGSFSGIVSNPPYIRADEMAELPPDVAKHEPHEALLGGADGLDIVRTLITESNRWLQPGGWMALEVDPGQCDAVHQLMNDSGFDNVKVRQDVFGADRVVHGRLPQPTAGS